VTVLLAILAGGLAAATTMTVAAVRARATDRVSIVDTAWGLGFVLASLAALAVALAAGDGDDRRFVLVGLVAVWGVRLSGRIHLRARRHRRPDGRLEEDFRYAELMDGRPFSYAVRHVFGIQGASLWLVSAPVLVGIATDTEWWWAVAVGGALWLVGFLFEAVGDAQLDAYKRLPDGERPPVMDRGLWAWTRHPNYFGDACVWWGLWLAGGVASGPVAAAATLVAPVAMTYFVVFATGARHLERSMMRRPGYPEYAARTPMVIPRPPRRR